MFNCLKYFDIFSQKPSLNIKGSKRAHTKFGSCISLITVCILITGIVFILNDYFQGLSYNVNSFVNNSLNPSISLKRLKLGFLIIDFYGKEFSDMERIFSLNAKFWDIKMPDYSNLNPNVTSKEINFKRCNEIK